MSLLTPQRPASGAHTDSAATMVPDQSRAERTTSPSTTSSSAGTRQCATSPSPSVAGSCG